MCIRDSFPTFDVDLVIAASRTSPPTFLPAVPPIYDALSRAAQQLSLIHISEPTRLNGESRIPA